MHKRKTTEWYNELKPTENELKMKICLLTLHLNHFNENELMFRRTLKKLFLIFFIFYFFLRHSKVDLRTSTYIFYNSAAPARTSSYSAVCGNTYVPTSNDTVLWQENQYLPILFTLILSNESASKMHPHITRTIDVSRWWLLQNFNSIANLFLHQDSITHEIQNDFLFWVFV